MNTETPKEVVKFSKPSLTKRAVRNVLWTIKTLAVTIGLATFLTIAFSMLGINHYKNKVSKIVISYEKANPLQKKYFRKEILEKNTNPFSIIGMQKITSSQSDIKKSFVKASLKYHPDKNKHSDGSKMRDINNAMEFLRFKESADITRMSNSLPKIIKKALAAVLQQYDAANK
jgi:preprotein translocase subunit Sec63